MMERKLTIKKPKRKFKLAKQELTLLLLLVIVLLGYLAYRFIYIPQTDKIAELAQQKLELQAKDDENREILRREAGINKEFAALAQEKQEILGRYFPVLDQAEMIYLVNNLVEDDRIDLRDMTFTRPISETIGDFEVKSMDIGMPYGGNYDGIMSIVQRLRTSPKKILVDKISMDRDDISMLNGTIAVKVYSLEGIADEAVSSGIIVEKSNNPEQNAPFGKFDYIESKKLAEEAAAVDAEPVEIDPFTYITLMDFESSNTFFMPSQPFIKGNVTQSKMAKSNKNSLRFEYNMLAIDDDKPNKAFIDVSRNKIQLKYPPSSINMWVYSYAYSPGLLSLEFKTQTGDMISVPMTRGIGWTGWKQVINLEIPIDLSQYPLTLNSISLEMPIGREDFGVILMDKLEALYEKNLDEDGKDNSATSNYFYHVVEKDDTVERISQMYYGNTKYVKEIRNLNELKAGQSLVIGKVLILKKRSNFESYFEEPVKLPIPEPVAPKPVAKKPATTTKPAVAVKVDPNAEKISHTVQKGENLYSISRKYYGNNNYVNEILQLNGMKQGDVLVTGKVLVLIKR